MNEDSNEKIGGYEVEFGSSMPMNFAKATMCDEEGKPVFCTCGKPAESAVYGTETCIALCNKCMFGWK
jgi:hypothetical protein